MSQASRETFDFVTGEPTLPGFYRFRLHDQGGDEFTVHACVHTDMTVTIPELNIEHEALRRFWNLEAHQWQADLPKKNDGETKTPSE